MTFTRPRAARRKIGSNRFSCQVYFATALTAKVSFIAHTYKSDTFSMEAAALKSNKFGESRLIKAELRWKRVELLFKLLKTFLDSGFAVASSCFALYIYFHARCKPVTISKQCLVSRRLKFSFCWAFLRNFPDTCLPVCVRRVNLDIFSDVANLFPPTDARRKFASNTNFHPRYY